MLAGDGDDLRQLPLSMRKTNLARLLARRPDGIFAAPFEQGEIGPDLFRAVCNMGLEGLVSKRRDRPYRSGRSPHWIKVKNRSHPAMSRVRDSF
jgi:bifunctional non-homologous end joining protein LigD